MKWFNFRLRASLLWSLWSLAALSGLAQEDCLTFDEPTANYCQNWVLIHVNNCQVVAQPPGGHNSPALVFTDGSGSSAAVNSVDFQGNWLERAQDGCLCFDYMVDLQYPHNPPPTWTVPNVILSYGGPFPNDIIRARLISVTNAPMQEDVWYKICLPIDSCRNGQLPSNGQFTWKIVKMPPTMDTCTAWNTLITNVASLTLGIDYHSSPSERVYFDNFCWRCTSSSDLCSELFAEAVIADTNCCTFEWPLADLSQMMGGIATISYQVIGGTMDTLIASSTPFCNYTTSPPMLNNTASGSLIFNPPCSEQLTLYGEVNPQTASGAVTVILTVTFAKGDVVCSDTLTLGCRRPPITRCDSLAVTPFIFPNLNLSGRTFRIFNQKQPASPIAEVWIDLIPDPLPGNPTLKWNGGGLQVDGTARSWGVANSGTPYYSRITMACGGGSAPQGAAANSTVQFNLGVDYTLGWTGDVVLTVIHCDGDTCRLVYENWCARPPKECLVKGPPVEIDPSIFLGRLLANSWTVTAPQVCYATVTLPAKLREQKSVQLLSASLLLPGARSEPLYDSSGREVVGIRLVKLCKYPGDSLPITVLVRVAENMEAKEVPLILQFYDQNANPLGDTVLKATMAVTQVEDYRQQRVAHSLRVLPNPAVGQVELEFWLQHPGWIRIELLNTVGQVVGRWEEYYGGKGWQRMGMETKRLEPGQYFVRLWTPSGTMLTAPVTVVR